MSEYHPVSCEFHSTLELHILQRQVLWLHWQNAEGESIRMKGLPRDLLTRNGEEFLVVENEAGEEQMIRLDQLTEFRQA